MVSYIANQKRVNTDMLTVPHMTNQKVGQKGNLQTLERVVRGLSSGRCPPAVSLGKTLESTPSHSIKVYTTKKTTTTTTPTPKMRNKPKI